MSAGSHAWVRIGLVWHTAFIVGSSVLVVFGAADARKYFSDPASSNVPSRMRMWISFLATAFVATSFSISHFALS